VRIPDVSPEALLAPARARLPPGAHPRLSMTAGEWLDVYGNQRDAWDCVVTCFFLVSSSLLALPLLPLPLLPLRPPRCRCHCRRRSRLCSTHLVVGRAE
jgi:N2227-like protein